ncbi:MAG: hypothetical protein JO249_09190 [Acidobacteria bacterium]|nr:hypothetical protein [Acidobacteriota bacterium]
MNRSVDERLTHAYVMSNPILIRNHAAHHLTQALNRFIDLDDCLLPVIPQQPFQGGGLQL